MAYYIDKELNTWIKETILANTIISRYIKKAGSNTPDGDSVFELFDDFSGGSIDSSKWQTSGDVSLSSGTVTINSGGEGWLASQTYFDSTSQEVVMHSYAQHVDDTTNTNRYGAIGFGWWNSTSAITNPANTGLSTISGWSNGDLLARYNTNETGTARLGHNLYGGSYVTREITLFSDYSANFYTPDSGESDTLSSISGTPTGGLPINFAVTNTDGGAQVKVQEVFVRKYISTEPTVTVEDLGDQYRVDITNTTGSALTDYQVRIPNGELGTVTQSESLQITSTPPPGSNVMAFKTTGSYNWEIPTGVSNVEVLVVAGGGAGGGSLGGGGGAGGLIHNTSFDITGKTSISLTVGAGGSGDSGNGNAGVDSVFDTLTAIGGGGGITGSGTTSVPSSANGGSGGGGSRYDGAGAGYNDGGSGTSGQGYDGGKGLHDNGPAEEDEGGGGGGGASEVGYDSNDSLSSSVIRNGGDGIYIDSFTGYEAWYAGGGGGGIHDNGSSGAGDGGKGGGAGGGTTGDPAGSGDTNGLNNATDGTSSSSNGVGGNGGINTGGGGGGAGWNSASGGDGGSGIVIISFEVNLGNSFMFSAGGF